MGGNHGFSVSRLPRSALLLLVSLAFLGKGEAQRQVPVPPQSEASATILAVPVKNFKVELASMQEALLKLRTSDVSRVVIGFERLPHHEGETGHSISMTLINTALGEVIRRLCEADPRYEYDVIEGHAIDSSLSGSMVEIRPKGALKNPDDLLNIKVEDYKVDARTAGAIEAIEHISEDAPELMAFLRQKHEEWVKKTGCQPGGFPGSIMSGNMPPPPFVLELHDVTVRQILDAISLKSIQRFKEGKNYGPVGWEYNFVIKPNASTGLGGVPTW